MTSALTLLDLLGFQYSKDKLQPFSDKTEMLGVELNLVDGKNGIVEVRNKASRANELCDVLDRILQSKKVSRNFHQPWASFNLRKVNYGEELDGWRCPN